MIKFHPTILAVCVLLALPPKGEAQLNGEYNFEVSRIFENSPFAFLEGNFKDGSHLQFCLDFQGATPESGRKFGSNDEIIIHNPRNGSFTINATTYFWNIMPVEFNPIFENDSWSFENNVPFQIIGKTYTNRKTRKSCMDISSGRIDMAGGLYFSGVDGNEMLIRQGQLTFRARNLDCHKIMNPDLYTEEEKFILPLTGKILLQNKKKVTLGTTLVMPTGLFWGGESLDINNPGDGHMIHCGLHLYLNISTNPKGIGGSAKLKYQYSINYITQEGYPDPRYEGWETFKEFNYSVKGTRKNGIATLNLAGLGVIMGLKATIYIDEESEEIIQNGKNSITLYGQTITY